MILQYPICTLSYDLREYGNTRLLKVNTWFGLESRCIHRTLVSLLTSTSCFMSRFFPNSADANPLISIFGQKSNHPKQAYTLDKHRVNTP